VRCCRIVEDFASHEGERWEARPRCGRGRLLKADMNENQYKMNNFLNPCPAIEPHIQAILTLIILTYLILPTYQDELTQQPS
jgi:hypothetical protein